MWPTILDDLVGDVEALKDEMAIDVEQVEKVERALEEAQEVVDDILDDEEPTPEPRS